jgi:UDP-glucose 4-epimerase
MSKILVTGGVGFIGAYLVKKLLEKKHKILIFDNLSTIGGIKHLNRNCKFIKGNLENPKDVKKIAKWKPEIIFHLAAQSAGESAYSNPKNDYLSNGFGTYNLCVLAKKINLKHFIYTSSVAVYGSNPKKKIDEETLIKPDSIYGVSKYVGEMFVNQELKKTKIKTTIFRVFNTYGPGEDLNFLKKGMVSIYSSYVWRNKPIIVKGSLDRIRDITYIDDVVNLLCKTIHNKKLKKNEVINLSSANSLTVKKLINEIILASKKKNVKIVVTKGTPGDSKIFHSSNQKLLKLYPGFKFTTINGGLKKYFEWINNLPVVNNLDNYHPFKKANF